MKKVSPFPLVLRDCSERSQGEEGECCDKGAMVLSWCTAGKACHAERVQ